MHKEEEEEEKEQVGGKKTRKKRRRWDVARQWPGCKRRCETTCRSQHDGPSSDYGCQWWQTSCVLPFSAGREKRGKRWRSWRRRRTRRIEDGRGKMSPRSPPLAESINQRTDIHRRRGSRITTTEHCRFMAAITATMHDTASVPSLLFFLTPSVSRPTEKSAVFSISGISKFNNGANWKYKSVSNSFSYMNNEFLKHRRVH